MVKKKGVKYFMVDAFTDSAFKGNPAAVCFLDNERDDKWLQSLATEFNISQTCFLTPITAFDSRFSLRWFTPVAEVDLCGHATLASAHCLFSNGLVDSEKVEFVTRSGILTAKRVSDGGVVKGGSFLIELDFPVVQTCDANLNEESLSMITKALNGATTIVDIKVTTSNNIIVELPSMESVTELQPIMDDILKCPCVGIIVTASVHAGSAYDFYSRYFAPKFGVNEDPVCGSAHCALAHYWSLKMNKCDFLAYQASPRSGTIRIHLDKVKQRVLLSGEAVTIMEGYVLEEEDVHDHKEASGVLHDVLKGRVTLLDKVLNVHKPHFLCVGRDQCSCKHCKLAHYWTLNQVDAFTDTPFKGNQAVVCFLDEDHERDDSWLQCLAAEFDLPLTCFLIPFTSSNPPRFHLRWFSPILEMDICGHATLASAHILFSNGLVGSSDMVEFSTHSGILTGKKLDDSEAKGSFSIELNFPVITTCEYSSNDFSMFSKAMNGATIVDVRRTRTDKRVFKPLKGDTKTTSSDQIMVVLSSWESVTEVQPRIDEIMKCPGKLMIVTAAAPKGSAYDYCYRLFAPKIGLNEDSVCGSAHCSLAHYWSLKMNKCDFVAYAASRRSGTVKTHYDKERQRVLITGKAVTVMKGSILV